jgi:hypothetical protein
MAAKNKRSHRSTTLAHDSVGLHSRASQLRDDLLEEAKDLQASGRIREARAVERRAAQAEQLAGALETELRVASGNLDPHAD